ncbi:outer membrane protein/peptidoglycan-associated (lipo)protein [Burkholderiales bacterium JOSHI_001]|nr:outer membrane protein/peptidoglycan-associated (lipo)protein [Burkholderiales bacterium JOSHI_001]
MNMISKHWQTGIGLALAALLAACVTTGPTENNDAQALDKAVQVAVDSLAAQTQKLPAFLAKVDASLNRRPVLIDPALDASTGQQTALTRQLDQRVAERLRGQHPQFDVLPFETASLPKAQYLITGTITRTGGAKSPFQIHLALTDLKSRNVVAQASSRARDEGFDTQPTPFYRDSPVLIKDSAVTGYVATSRGVPGQPADKNYLDRVAAAVMIQEATTLYNSERYEQALGAYRNVLATPAGEQMRTLNGIYLASWKLGRNADAENAFGRLVALGLGGNNLGVKFLFNPGTTDFWSDAKVSGPYPLWLRQIARQAAAAKVCMTVVGHTSKTGSEPLNDRLSAQRAAFIQRKLEQESAELSGRMKSSGMGFKETLIGTGTDDASDALDRRVEFKVSGCGA